MTNGTMITIISALIAALSFAAFALPFLNRTEKKERYKNVIEKKRKDLFQETRQALENKNKTKQKISAKDSMATFYKMQQMAGAMGEKARDKLLQAGIRSPSAPVKFIAAQIILPILFCGLTMLFVTVNEIELGTVMLLLILYAALFIGYKLPDVLIKNQVQKRQQEINLSFPDALDMMLICVQGGIGLEQTVERIATEVAEHSDVLAEELGILSAEMAMLNDRKQALKDFARRVGSGAAKSFATALIQAEQYGTSVTQAMQVISDEMRDMRMATAEEKAASLPPKLTIPMILFFLPALFVIILGPAGIDLSRM